MLVSKLPKMTSSHFWRVVTQNPRSGFFGISYHKKFPNGDDFQPPKFSDFSEKSEKFQNFRRRKSDVKILKIFDFQKPPLPPQVGPQNGPKDHFRPLNLTQASQYAREARGKGQNRQLDSPCKK